MNYSDYEVIDQSQSNSTAELTRSFFANVYKYMFLALLVSGFTAWFTAGSEWYYNLVAGGMGMFIYVIMFAPLLLVIAIQARINKMSFSTAMLMYVLYSILIGVSLAFIFLIYTSASVTLTFFVTAGAFGSMALLGYFTKTDLSKMGSLLYMVFIGMFIAGIANMFMGSEPLSYIISFLGLIVFTGLTAWEMQRLKGVSADPAMQGENRKKAELMGGLMLYILFINLFMSILRFLGDR